MRREEFYETLVSFLGFTQVFGIAVRKRTNIALTERTDLSSAHHVPIAAATKDQFFSRRCAFCFRAWRTYLDEIVREWKLSVSRSICVLEYQFEATVIEGNARRLLHLRDAFA